MEVKFRNEDMLHLRVSPSYKSWSILVGIIAVGIGAAYYSPDEHALLKVAYLVGCLFLGLTFLDDWEDCVIDRRKRLITLTRKTWLESILSKCSDSKTLILEASSIIGVHTVPCNKIKSEYKVALVLSSEDTICVSETSSGTKPHQEYIAKCIREILSLDHVEQLGRNWEDVEDDNHSVSSSVQVESLSSNIIDIEEKEDNEMLEDDFDYSESDTSSSLIDEELLADDI